MKNIKQNWKIILISIAAVISTILVCVFVVQGSQNKAISFEEQVRTADSDIKVQEKRRVDLIYNLADFVMQYDKHEANTIIAIADSRKSSDIESAITSINAVAEAYPELKSQSNYKTTIHNLRKSPKQMILA